MKNNFLIDKSISLNVNKISDQKKIISFGKAISNEDRIRILYSLQKKPMNLSALSLELNLPISTIYNHIQILEESGLIKVNYIPTPKGHMKLCNISVLKTTLEFFQKKSSKEENEIFSYEMPIGYFSECKIFAPCGIATHSSIIHPVDNPKSFFVSQRINAQLIWFSYGHISYNFPNYFLSEKNYHKISFEFEICSETYYYNNNWPSDITIGINNFEILTFTSPGDFGGRRGTITPKFWASNSTQYGLLKKIEINDEGVFLDNSFIRNDITFDNLNLNDNDFIKLKFEIKESAQHRGGMNLFGKEFGDYPQSIIMTLT